MQTGNCFRCRQPGHWINDCPLKSNADDSPPSIQCPCGGGLCEIKVSKTQKNPKRRFYKCPAAQDCKFFKWCDNVTDEDIRFRPAFTIPDCPCGSGPCRRVTADSGSNAGRAYLGFGACGFFKWEDEMAPSCDAVDEIDFWVEADLILSDVESSFQAASVPEDANQVAPLGKECQASIITEEDDSIFENLEFTSVSDMHSASVNQGIPLSDSIVIEPEEQWMKSLRGDDQPTSCALSKLSVDEAMSGLVRDAVSSVSVVKHETKNHERPVAVTSEAECSFPNLQDLIEQYNSEKLRLECVSGKHVQVLNAFMSSYSRLRLLHEKTSHLRKLLLVTEKEMACCEAETLELGASCREVAGEMAESQKRMQETADKLGKEVEVLKQKEFVDMKRIKR
ncbi:uncharacterized protein LOC18019076 isoform X2 [Eutrema salsugineum]|uniref:uncharacterized protein LOC18019076 isoform X2 n=1 Tax=Eutrema salsugineum TaxID=72664 RepID=UPI000CECF9CA|nr:uncharacterized protein LOC18019076 isoform X2 [Eutrema salsugineum]